jgi:hypothetical protein
MSSKEPTIMIEIITAISSSTLLDHDRAVDDDHDGAARAVVGDRPMPVCATSRRRLIG